MNILVTGVAGFIGFHLAKRLLENGENVFGIDNVNDYYDVNLKRERLRILHRYSNFYFYEMDICNFESLKLVFRDHTFHKVCHLAAQAGVRYSITNPFAYQKSNNEGFLNIMECVRHNKPDHFIYASSSSVYGHCEDFPFSETSNTDSPISLYAVTKKSNELVAHCYSHLYDISCSGLRFFTAYGPYGRPDMALFIFTKAIMEGKPIQVFNNGNMKRNFTYIDDVIEGILIIIRNTRSCEIYNIGNDKTVELMKFISEIEKNVGKKAIIDFQPMQLGDMAETKADIRKISGMGYKPKVDVEEGIKKFVEWYREFYKCEKDINSF